MLIYLDGFQKRYVEVFLNKLVLQNIEKANWNAWNKAKLPYSPEQLGLYRQHRRTALGR